MTEEQGLKECESYVQEHKIQQILKECIVQVRNVLLLYIKVFILVSQHPTLKFKSVVVLEYSFLVCRKSGV